MIYMNKKGQSYAAMFGGKEISYLFPWDSNTIIKKVNVRT